MFKAGSIHSDDCDLSHGVDFSTAAGPRPATSITVGDRSTAATIDAFALDGGSPTDRVTDQITLNLTTFPVELLCEVFSYLIWSRQATDLVAATQVCRHWRIAALNNPLLWRHVSVTSVHKAQEYFKRSRDVILDVHVARSCDVDGIVHLLRCHSARIHSLHIDVESDDPTVAARYLEQLCQLSIPRLEQLYLDGPPLPLTEPSLTASEQEDLTAVPVCNGLAMSSPAPLLRSLRLRPFCLPWHSLMYRDLRTLDLDASANPAPSMKRLLNILHQCPLLKSFRLRSSALEGASQLSQADPEWMVHLPHLTDIHLDGPSPHQIAQLLEHLALPSTTRYVISTTETPTFPSQYPVLPADRTFLFGLTCLRAIDFTQEDSKHIVVTGYRFSLSDEGPIIIVHVEVTDPAAAVTRLSSIFDAKHVESLAISLHETAEVPLANWHAVFSDFVNLRSLHLASLTNNSLRSVLGALRMPVLPDHSRVYSRHRAVSVPMTPTDATHPPSLLFCSKLARLVISNAERPSRISTDVTWLCAERRRRGRALSSVEADPDTLSEKCISDLQARGVDVLIRQ
ncbi:hypothetical protein BD309DRAFT_350355 [Dichomitus squalens]|uniref:Uncharacterized protein n=1 Tax=Dichomitus squalens TaxID=114155 RepID=A0A4Q9NGU9_9APHY|nr:hypothetical protein BD309DRAFT_350355 [Dichomitus squalens]TBU52232.1 hypothetical protein BD310DRAFT_940696 [Dichomitus squalens]